MDVDHKCTLKDDRLTNRNRLPSCDAARSSDSQRAGARRRPPPRQPHADHRRGRARARPRSSRSASPTSSPTSFPPEAIVAFTFTERAAAELKDRIIDRVEGRLGRAGARPAHRPVRRNDPRVLLPPAAAARAALRDLRRPRRQPAHRVPVARGTSARDPAARPRRSALRVDRRVPVKAWTSSRTSCSTPLRCPTHSGRSSATTTRRSSAIGCSRTASRSSARYASWRTRARRADPRDAPPPDRRRVPGRQPGPGAAHRAPHGPGRRALRRRRRPAGDLPVARIRRPQHRQVRDALRRRRDLRDHHEPTIASGDHRDGQRSSRSPSRAGSTKTMLPFRPSGGPEPDVVVWTRGHLGRRGRPDRLAHRPSRSRMGLLRRTSRSLSGGGPPTRS